jgi:hypothetical protein|tara:strand:+ start:68 stop:211 length:144 start_codon:yes stop_codon:yes gene_type:complete
MGHGGGIADGDEHLQMADFKLRHAKYYMNDIHVNSEILELDAQTCCR